MAENRNNRQLLLIPYQWLTIAAGTVVCIFSAWRLDVHGGDLTFVILITLSLLFGTRIVVRIPRFSSQISLSDTFIFLTLLLYGSDFAVLLAAVEAFLTSHRFNKQFDTDFFNWSAAALSTFVTAQVLAFVFGDLTALHRSPISLRFATALAVMAILQFGLNSTLIAVCTFLRSHEGLRQILNKHYLWTAVTYFAGASTAGLVAKLIALVGIYALIITAPIIAIVFLTYRTYLKNLESSAAQAEQARRHVQELSHYIAEQERIQQQFSQVEKLSALGELASGVAHDFNNTLAGILGRAQLLLRTNDPEKIRRGLNIIIKTAEDGARTVKRIQDFARQRRDKDFTLIAVDQILTDVSEITRPRWKNKSEAANVYINLELKIQSKAKIQGDESELREVLINMVFNAIDAMPSGGRLTLASEETGGTVILSVSDTGIGMSPEVQSRIFDPFFTTKGKAGLGLGLAVSFGIIRRHEAHIEVESETGRGTTFRIVLPIAKQAPESLLDASTDITCPDGGMNMSATLAPVKEQPQILVVDDEDYVRDLLRDMLESEDCRVFLAGSGPEALALFDARTFDAIFTDVGMPGMSGWELAQVIRQRNQTVPIAVITGWGEAVGTKEQKDAAVDWVVSKPFSADKVTELVADIKQRASGKGQPSRGIVAA